MMNSEEMTKSMILLMMLLVAFMFSKTHIMNNLIIIEFIIITLLMIMFTLISHTDMENYLILNFTVIVICESMMGLSMMIAMIRTHGNDYIKSMNIIKF